jgi:hypothetical protein
LDDIKDKIKEFKKDKKRDVNIDELKFEVTREGLSKYKKTIDSPEDRNTPWKSPKTLLFNTKIIDKPVPTKYIGYSPMRLKKEYSLPIKKEDDTYKNNEYTFRTENRVKNQIQSYMYIQLI